MTTTNHLEHLDLYYVLVIFQVVSISTTKDATSRIYTSFQPASPSKTCPEFLLAQDNVRFPKYILNPPPPQISWVQPGYCAHGSIVCPMSVEFKRPTHPILSSAVNNQTLIARENIIEGNFQLRTDGEAVTIHLHWRIRKFLVDNYHFRGTFDLRR